jgi:hypothetical protein
MVTVISVEKSWYTRAEIDMVVSFRLQYTIDESSWMMKRITLPNQPSHDELFEAATVSTSVNAVLAALTAVSMVEDRLSEDIILACAGKYGASAVVKTRVRLLHNISGKNRFCDKAHRILG